MIFVEQEAITKSSSGLELNTDCSDCLAAVEWGFGVNSKLESALLILWLEARRRYILRNVESG